MNKREQSAFVHELSETVARQIIHEIQMGRIPGNWDGHELRELLSLAHKRSGAISPMKGKRKREFNNVILVNNL